MLSDAWRVTSCLSPLGERPPAVWTSAPLRVSTNATKMAALWSREPDDDVISVDGITRFCEELEVEPTDIVVLIISCYMVRGLEGGTGVLGGGGWGVGGSPRMVGESGVVVSVGHDVYCRCFILLLVLVLEEFTSGLVKLGVDSIDKLRRKLTDLRSEVKTDAKFKEVYAFAYNFSREKGQKCVMLDTAVAMWQLLFSVPEQRWPLIDDWCEFLTKHHNRAISKDTWLQLFDFIKASSVKPDFSNFDENSAWPYLLDEFVEYMKNKRGAQGGQ
ncbi:hypothetical protein VOLCADRAFT_88591 [Volvox carteri f. nagariensis]|uniref:Defective in cullin neddylation protein n=1 Tax=Volvox carteri f. nagariensis TaxID=3068 RepID=D8TPE8_VOLCA|nr:uncharacterized protein VOLCADRAFT_88591 [Volvox carteri f. nagariensis]EFJ50752.1 hypothetical protein VOLCADRAFT_88591 [Volvox carteri f. nagariensis]|eukprot:XP_002948345.1 hypothetical protein VOLCADRAFT_88591 [Volvox carteri f. nagariensis]